ncbi:MAG: aconitase X [Gemmatimonadota bacterium]
MRLTPEEEAVLRGDAGPAASMAMRVVAAAADLVGASCLVEITSAHIDGCLYHGDGGVLFAERLVEGGGRVAVPTTLNVGALDLLRPGRVKADEHTTAMARRQMEAYVQLGCSPTWTCTPYHVGHRPGAGEQIAWGESNAIAFANSVLGARTERYGDFLDACCAVTGRAPMFGLHLEENRVARVVVDVTGVPDALKARDEFYPVLGIWLGRAVGDAVPALVGLPETVTEDQLKALGAAAAASGSVALFHVVGVTPEAPTLEAATGGETDLPVMKATGQTLREALDGLSTAAPEGDVRVDAVAVGSPHFSLEEFHRLADLLGSSALKLPFYACTSRHVWSRVKDAGLNQALEGAGVQVVVDTCVVVTPILPRDGGILMTNSGKFARYGPSNTGFQVIYGSLEDCVATAAAGRLRRDVEMWTW